MYRAAAWLRFLVVLGCAAVSLGTHGCRTPESAYQSDIRSRGKESQGAWLDATDGRYNGDLPPYE